MRRAFRLGNTGVGEAISFSTAQFDAVTDCVLWVMDVSGDGDENVGFTVGTARREAMGRGIIINGLAIEGPAPAGRSPISTAPG
jgi:Ca-activated chloride channel homolog